MMWVFNLIYLCCSTCSIISLLLSTQTASKDSDSLIHAESYQYSPSYFDPDRIWWKHPRVKENWKVVAAAFALVIIGLGISDITVVLSAFIIPAVFFMTKQVYLLLALLF